MNYEAVQLRHYAIITKNGKEVPGHELKRENKFLYLSEAWELCDELNENKSLIKKALNKLFIRISR